MVANKSPQFLTTMKQIWEFPLCPSSGELGCGSHRAAKRQKKSNLFRRKVIYSLFPSTVSSQFKCRAGKSSRAEGELGWGQPGLPRAGLAAHPHLQDNGRNKELLGAQTSLLAQSWNQVKSDPSLSLEHLPACRKLSREATPGHGHQALPSGKGPLP